MYGTFRNSEFFRSFSDGCVARDDKISNFYGSFFDISLHEIALLIRFVINMYMRKLIRKLLK